MSIDKYVSIITSFANVKNITNQEAAAIIINVMMQFEEDMTNMCASREE